jgi:hypothetical protein
MLEKWRWLIGQCTHTVCFEQTFKPNNTLKRNNGIKAPEQARIVDFNLPPVKSLFIRGHLGLD